jgi:epoxyqueuosine reductase QueG
VTASPERAALAALAEAGLGLHGVLARADWDARVPAPFRADAVLPGARSALVLGSGGRALFAAFARAPEAALAADPLDAFTQRVVGEAAARLRAAGASCAAVFAHEARGGVFADFVALGRACGLGWPSRLGLLLHPTCGPWTSLRAALLTDAALAATPPLPGAGPCPGCAAPCARACPGGALEAAAFDARRCGATRRSEPACAERCAARRACPVGAEHAYAPRAEAHHMRAALPRMTALGSAP